MLKFWSRSFLIILLALGINVPINVSSAPHIITSGNVITAQRDRNVEPWGYVWNPTSCLWDPDDQENTIEQGNLYPGTITKTGCLIAHTYQTWATINGMYAFWSITNHPNLHFIVESPKPLTVSICYQPQGYCRTITASSNPDFTYHYEGCIAGPRYDNDSPSVIEIPNSNGGVGVRTTYTLSVTNITDHIIKPVWVVVRGGNDQNNCPTVPYVYAYGPDYSFQYQQP